MTRRPEHIAGSRSLYLFSLILLAFSLTVAPFFISVATFLLAGNWLAEGNFREKRERLRHRPSLLLFVSLYVPGLIGMLYTSDLHYGLHDLIIKLPLVVVPLVVGTTDPLSFRELKLILYALMAGLWVSTLTAMAVLAGWTGKEIRDIREISVFISHIRLSLFIGVTQQAILYLLLGPSGSSLRRRERTFLLITLIWLVLFLFILKSLTGFLMLTILFVTLFIFLVRRAKDFMLRYFIIILGITMVLLAAGWLSWATSRFHTHDPLPDPAAAGTTANGRPYDPPANLEDVENGHYVWWHVCEEELEQAWNRASTLDYDSTDLAGQCLRTTLIRYMTSLGLRKDSLGFTRLSPEDIRNIEKGLTNYLFAKKLALYPYFYQLMWEREEMKKGRLSALSHAQRLIYLRTGWHILRDHPWTGVGTGDVPATFRQYYKKEKTGLSERWQLRAHNQYLTFGIAYGIPGALWFLIAFFLPFFMEKGYRDYLALLFMVIASLSMLYEDTLETQAGVYFVAFFYSIWIFGRNIPFQKQGKTDHDGQGT